MKLSRSDLVALLIVALLAAGFWYLRHEPGGVVLSLIDQYAGAERRSALPLDQAFRLVDVTIGGQARRAIFMHPTSRLIYHDVAIPEHAWLRVYIALSPEVWERKGDGVLFRFGVSDGRTYDEYVKEVVDPIGNPDHRRWLPLEVDLSRYAGEHVDLIFNTNTGLNGDNGDNDWALWGLPELFVRP